MGIKKYKPSLTQAVQVIIVVVLAGALGVTGWIQTKVSGLLGRIR